MDLLAFASCVKLNQETSKKKDRQQECRRKEVQFHTHLLSSPKSTQLYTYIQFNLFMINHFSLKERKYIRIIRIIRINTCIFLLVSCGYFAAKN